jgi:hypothetical protein
MKRTFVDLTRDRLAEIHPAMDVVLACEAAWRAGRRVLVDQFADGGVYLFENDDAVFLFGIPPPRAVKFNLAQTAAEAEAAGLIKPDAIVSLAFESSVVSTASSPHRPRRAASRRRAEPSRR